MRAVPGAIAKAGAESCYAVALADGRAFALKIDDGAVLVKDVLAGEEVEKQVYVEDQTFTQEQAAEVIDSRPY